jgi:hypothetical protein
MRIIKRRTIILIALCVGLGFFLGYKAFVSPQKTTETWVVPNVQDISKRFITEEALVNEIHQKQELITLEIQMTENVTLSNSWGNLEIFKKVQGINYSGTGSYTVDLSSLKAENIIIDDKNKNVNVKVASPTIKGVSISEEKTEYKTPENGLLRFGEIKLTPEENQMLLSSVKDKMLKKMSEQDFTSQAKASSEKTIKNLIQSVISNKTAEPYNIEVQFQ